MGSHKLQSFQDFSKSNLAVKAAKVEEEQSIARDTAANQFKSLLSEFGVTSVKELKEEDKTKFYEKLGASEISEAIAIIEEGTRSQIGIINKRGKISAVYMHYDGYPDHMLPTIKKGYKDGSGVNTLLKKGGASGLEADPSQIKFYGDKTTLDGDAKKINDFLRDASEKGGAEFVYLFDQRDGSWYMADVYAETGLLPAFESLTVNEASVIVDATDPESRNLKKLLKKHKVELKVLREIGDAGGHPEVELTGKRKDIEAVLADPKYGWDDGDGYIASFIEESKINEAFKPSKGNARDAKKVNKSIEKFFMEHPALAAPGIILGVCKYIMAEALTDANFHSYRDPVSKVIKGKITTVMVELDSLGGMSVPVGKKTIINLLDDKGAFMANAAGWSGIGIVEGMALFLDGFGHSDTAQKIADTFDLIWANESIVTEGNAFLAARAKAIEEDAEEFEFNGKNFPVIKEEVKETEKA